VGSRSPRPVQRTHPDRALDLLSTRPTAVPLRTTLGRAGLSVTSEWGEPATEASPVGVSLDDPALRALPVLAPARSVVLAVAFPVLGAFVLGSALRAASLSGDSESQAALHCAVHGSGPGDTAVLAAPEHRRSLTLQCRVARALLQQRVHEGALVVRLRFVPRRSDRRVLLLAQDRRTAQDPIAVDREQVASHS
jgi:hypothetical protein